MSLDNFQIPSSLVPELYKDSLVVLDGKQPNKETLNQKKLSTLGENKKNILILIQDDNSLHLSDADLQFFTGILSACKFSFADIQLLNLAKNNFTAVEDIVNELTPNKIIAFGVDSISFPIEISHYRIVKNKKHTYLTAPSLSELSKNTEAKKELWICLKTIFEL
jgi:hypothetical protein